MYRRARLGESLLHEQLLLEANDESLKISTLLDLFEQYNTIGA